LTLTPSIDSLARALDATGDVVAGIRDDQWSNATPCTEWDVRAVLNHLVGGTRLFAALLAGQEPPPPDVRMRLQRIDQLGDHPVSAYREAAAALLAAASQPDVLDRYLDVLMGRVPAGVALHARITDALVHGWDLARATGQPARFPDDVAEQEIAAIRAVASGRLGLPSLEAFLARPPAGTTSHGEYAFGPEQPVADDAPAVDRLAALLGRPVDGTSGTEVR
jgi:uncharacterized protein (TIGR03086 family)